MSDAPRERRPPAERARLQSIRSVDLKEARPTFERIARLAQQIAVTHFAHVSIVEAKQLWIAGVGDVELPPVPKELAFASFAIEQEAVMWVEDATLDHRFDGNLFVHGGPALRFYAGAPITLSNGARIGAVSVLDRAPRRFDAGVAARLEDLAALVADEWERRLAIKKLDASRARARAAHKVLAGIVDNAPVALVMIDAQLRVLRASPQWRKDVGIVGPTPRGRSIYDLFPGFEARWGHALRRALTGQTVRASRIRMNLPDGSAPWMRAEVSAWRDSAGRVGGLLMMSHDISDMVEALDKTSRSEQNLKLAMEIGGLTMWELDHRRRAVSRAGALEIPIDPDHSYEEINRRIWAAVHPKDREAAKDQWRAHERGAAPFRATFRLMQKDGPHIWVQSASEAIRGEDGQLERVVGVLRNIDEQKRSELALAKARDAAEAANRAKSEFLANMSHEIRTPLNGVMGVASALGRTALDAAQREMIGLIESSAKTLESLLSDVLDLARIESGRLVLDSEPFELRRCILDVAALFEPGARAKGLEFAVDIAPEIEGLFLGDAPRIRQVLSNLVSNAIKFTAHGGVRLSATALRTPEGIEARMAVKDDGIGFDEETKARLFDRFVQADGSITRRFGGTGLGLAISRSLAEGMGGSLSASSEPGEGAVFAFQAPLPRAAAAAACAAHEADDASLCTPISSLRVLLAEDHPTNRRVVELILQAADVDLTSVEDGALAVSEWEIGAYDLVLMDMQMPVMDGLTAIREIRAREARRGGPRTTIFALTANAMPEHVRASQQAGADGHLAKPITAAALLQVVETAAMQAMGEASDSDRQSA